MSESIDAKTAARERLFDAVLADAVAAEGAVVPAQSRPQWARVAVVLLATLVTVGVALLQGAARRDEAQDPEAFDPLFPRIEREFHRDRLAVQLYSVEQVRQLPEGPLPPLKVLAAGVDGSGPVPLAVLEELYGRRGVRSLTVAGDSGLPKEAWRGIAAMPDLEVLTIGCEVDAECVRELRHAPRLRALGLTTRVAIDRALFDAVHELPRLDTLQLVRLELPSAVLAALGGLPGLHSLYIEGCTTEPDWLVAIAGLRTVRWLGLVVGQRENGVLTAADLRRLGALPRLESLTLAKVEIAAADFAALPASLQVLALPGSVPPAVVRDLLARPKLRGLRLGPVEPEVEAVLCELLPTTKLERLGIGGGISEPLFRAIGRLPRLRHLSFSAFRDVVIALERVVQLKQLEHLEFQASVPAVEQLRVLRELPELRRVVITSVGDGRAHTADLAALQSALGPRVHLIVR